VIISKYVLINNRPKKQLEDFVEKERELERLKENLIVISFEINNI
jgi:hypothetical protein